MPAEVRWQQGRLLQDVPDAAVPSAPRARLFAGHSLSFLHLPIFSVNSFYLRSNYYYKILL